jgi:hypothetical protein
MLSIHSRPLVQHIVHDRNCYCKHAGGLGDGFGLAHHETLDLIEGIHLFYLSMDCAGAEECTICAAGHYAAVEGDCLLTNSIVQAM